MLRQKNRNTTGVTIFLENPVSPLKTGLTGLIYYFSVKDKEYNIEALSAPNDYNIGEVIESIERGMTVKEEEKGPPDIGTNPLR